MKYITGWYYLFDGYCASEEKIELGRHVQSLTACQSLCVGSCRYVSYSQQGDNVCFGHESCTLDGDNLWNYVTYLNTLGEFNYS